MKESTIDIIYAVFMAVLFFLLGLLLLIIGAK
jgi:hypothetical protein